MPIVDPPIAGYPLSQGDILRGITLYATKTSWNEKGGEVVKAPFNFCLVVSRQCVIAHKRNLTVVAVEKFQDNVPREIDNFEKVIDFITGVRDGVTSPDVFYLGQLPGIIGRYCARLDSFYNIEIPLQDGSDKRDVFVNHFRVAALNTDFIRALHTRLFGAFASMGFDDNAWASNEDLRWIVSQGEADIAIKEGELRQLQALKISKDLEGKRFDEKSIDNADKALKILRDKVAPYALELSRREKAVPLNLEVSETVVEQNKAVVNEVPLVGNSK